MCFVDTKRFDGEITIRIRKMTAKKHKPNQNWLSPFILKIITPIAEICSSPPVIHVSATKELSEGSHRLARAVYCIQVTRTGVYIFCGHIIHPYSLSYNCLQMVGKFPIFLPLTMQWTALPTCTPTLSGPRPR